MLLTCQYEVTISVDFGANRRMVLIEQKFESPIPLQARGNHALRKRELVDCFATWYSRMRIVLSPEGSES